MKPFQTYVSEWESNAAKDAYWAVLTSSKFEKSAWDKQLFFQSGMREIVLLKEYIEKTRLPVEFKGSALDFGCGTGRLSQALGNYFDKVYGVDISANMIQKANEALSSSTENIKYIHNPLPNLKLFESDKFNFIYSNIVLQHIGKKHQWLYLKEFLRIIKSGGWIIIQIPSQRIFSSIRQKIRGKITELLPYKLKKQILVHIFGNQSRALKEFDFEINTLTEHSIKKFAEENNLDLKSIIYTNSCEPDFCGNLVFKSYEEAKSIPGFLSPMYFLQKQFT